MGKIGLIIAREYLSRVRKKSFIIMTAIGPLLFAGIAIVPTWLATRDSTDKMTVKILDESGYFENKLVDGNSIRYEMTDLSLDEAKEELRKKKDISLLYIPKIDIDNQAEVSLYSFNNPGISLKNTVERAIRNELENIKLVNSGIEKERLDKLKAKVDVSTFNLSQKGKENESSSEASSAIGYISSFMIYFFIFFYGAQIMRGVVEEKTSKVIEVIISSVRPFQLMMGKIIGVGAVGLTQFILWVALSTGIITVATSVILKDANKETIETIVQDQPIKSPIQNTDTGNQIFDALKRVNFPLVIGCFAFYFIGGYLLYGALFAAVGSAVDSDADTQQFMLPITIPLIFSMVIIGAVLKDPHGSLAIWTSMIPFTAPVVMMMRIPFDVPAWQIALSMLSVVVGFLFTTWFAGRIYRIGIFMHGTKVNYKILAKWFMMKI
jgi:ABC-2 type transport system permease protein